MENKIFVAVGKELEERRSVLKWALKKFKGETICVFYVHVPSQMIPLPNGFQVPVTSLQEAEVKAFHEQERKEVYKILDDCLQMCAKYLGKTTSLVQVPSEKIFIEKESITDGILELVSQLRIGKLVMGAAANSKYSRRMRKPMSKKAHYVLNCAPDFCCIWFICKGHLICMREGMKQPDQHVRRNRFIGFSYSEPLVYSSSTESLGISSPLTQSMYLGSSPASIMLPSMINEDLYEKLQQALEEAEKLRQETCAESERRQKAEKEAMEANFQVKEAEEELNKVKEDLKETKFELHKYSQMLIKVANKISSLKQTEHDNSVQLIGGSKKVAQEPSSSHLTNFSCEFSLLDLKEATKCFDTSLIIEKGEYGSVYKGFLYHTEVTIKILKPISLQAISEFKQEVNVLSKLRHPNLVTLVGACPDSLALIYEYLPNRSLGDRLSCNDNTPSLPWKTRIRILTELNSVLNFLHSIQPCSIIHSNLNLKNILLDANFCCKLTDFGSCHIIPKNRQIVTAEPKGNSPYMDPEFIETGHLSRKSDVYSFGIIALQLLTGRPALKIIEEVRHALENDNLDSMLDPSAGDWPFVRAKQLAYMALKCCDAKGKNRPELGSEVWSVLKPLIYPHGRLVCGDQVPSYFICPIFQEIMRDPHFAADGFTYEADALRGWFEGGHDTSPMTNLKLINHNLTPNRALRSTIQEWLQQHQHDL